MAAALDGEVINDRRLVLSLDKLARLGSDSLPITAMMTRKVVRWGRGPSDYKEQGGS